MTHIMHTCVIFFTNDIVLVQQVDPNAEVMHWLEVKHLKKTYSQPFVVPSDLLQGYVVILS